MDQPARDGSLQRSQTAPETAISRALARLLREMTGRGPADTRVTLGRDHVLVILDQTLTHEERTLVDAGYMSEVTSVRAILQEVMRARAIAIVEEAVGRPVEAFLSANHVDPDVAAEVFLLAPRSGR